MAKRTRKKAPAKKANAVEDVVEEVVMTETVTVTETPAPAPLPATQVNLLAAQAQIDRNTRGG